MNETILKLLTEEFPEVDFSASDTLVDDGILRAAPEGTGGISNVGWLWIYKKIF